MRTSPSIGNLGTPHFDNPFDKRLGRTERKSSEEPGYKRRVFRELSISDSMTGNRVLEAKLCAVKCKPQERGWALADGISKSRTQDASVCPAGAMTKPSLALVTVYCARSPIDIAIESTVYQRSVNHHLHAAPAPVRAVQAARLMSTSHGDFRGA